jgi:long-subunit acyl-CoA synthetase (AMP-forming)
MTETVEGAVDLGAPVEAATIPEAFRRTVARYPDKIAYRTRGGGQALTWAELDQRVRAVGAGLAALGLRPGGTVAVLLPNIIECHLVDYAVSLAGGVPFTIFNSSAPDQIAYQVRNAEATIMITDRAFADKVGVALDTLDGQVTHLVVIDAESGLNLAAVEAAGDPAFDFAAVSEGIGPDDVATMIYTSGTTGPPKAALWSHRTVLAQQRALDEALPLPRIGIVDFLPMAHAGGRINVHYMSLVYGATVTVCPDIRDLSACLVDARPDVLFSTPRAFEKLQVGIESLLAAESAERQAEIRRVIDIGLQRSAAEDNATDVPADAAADLVAEHERGKDLLKPLLAHLGLDRVVVAIIGGAPTPPEIVRYFFAVGLPVLEAYGATEVSLNIFNRLDDFKTGSAGKPLPGVEIKVAEDGELLARADMNMIGYRNEPEKTAETIDSDGWVHTGDIVRVDADGFVSIVDRKKEIMINGVGKNLSPAYIETTISGESPLIGQVVAIGEGRRYVGALITLDREALPAVAARLGLTGRSVDELVASEEIRAEVQAAVDRGNERLNGNEQVRSFVIVPDAWVPDSDELTPTAKLKRRIIHVKYADQIESLYP